MDYLKQSVFTISLDFELHWGVSENRTVESYKENLDNVPRVVNRLLQLFKDTGIHATWATVGMLFCENKRELVNQVLPYLRPVYTNKNLSNYRLLSEIGDSEEDDPYHYAISLIQSIQKTPFQEIGTHTFSHYYCLEEGQKPENLEADLTAAINIAKTVGIKLNSIVFPRNQYNMKTLDICYNKAIRAFRGTESHWIYRSRSRRDETLLHRFMRLIDAYIPIQYSNTYDNLQIKNGLLNIPSSRFLRPYSHKLSFLEPLKLDRIKREMERAAKQNHLYHLWWHPHNFGMHIDQNFNILEDIISHYLQLHKSYNMTSMNMNEITKTYFGEE